MTLLTLEALWQMELETLVQEHGSVPDPDLWRWSPLELAEFDRMLYVARAWAMSPSNSRLRFGEAGSGIGTKLYLAKHYYEMDEMGYEINEDYLTVSRFLGVHAEKCDLRTDVPPWAKFDIVYISRPLKSDESNTVNPDEAEIAWEKSVMDAMRPGAVLMSAFAAVKPGTWAVRYRRPFRGVWVKPEAPGPQAIGIQRSATHPDPLVPDPGPRLRLAGRPGGGRVLPLADAHLCSRSAYLSSAT